MTPPTEHAEEWDDVEDPDDDLDEAGQDGPVPISCQWGMPGWCATGRHHRCYFTTNAEAIKTGTYGHHHGHVWVCPCPCHAHQGYPPCPHPDHAGRDGGRSVDSAAAVQMNLF